MAIQSVSFMGREGCITPSVKKSAEKIVEKATNTITEQPKVYMGKEPNGYIEKQLKESLGSLRPSDEAAYKASRGELLDNSNILEELQKKAAADSYAAAHGNPVI